MLTGALRTLAERPTPVVSAAFLWKLLSLEGFHPLLDCCARCDAVAEFVAFDLHEGGVLCARCAMGGGRRVSADSLALLRKALGGGLADVLAEPPSQATAELEHLAVAAVEHHLERRLRSAALL
jgi:DNA repair protein RecO (recombination protein O)